MALFDNINLSKLKSGLSKTRDKIVNSINEKITGKAVIDENIIDEIEEILITSDIGFDTAEKIIENLRVVLKSEKDRSQFNIINTVKDELVSVISNGSADDKNKEEDIIKISKPYVILIVGVNGVGKTTTIGKLAHNFHSEGAKVLIGAADTFRAAAGEQLDIWAERAGADIVQKESGSDPSSVAFETVEKAVNENYDFVLIDTAGRLHNKANLMNELAKIKRAINKVLPGAPHDTFLILDGTVGQNALIQADEFSKVTDISGLIITKLDGTAKGGVVFQICNKQSIPVKFIGVGETIEDLQTFNPKIFVDAIFGTA
ncbi:MAG: signal recognition particle-docking protein FtsY [Bacteroidetes bacterium]|nr:signal recognition particle-docking protein FtsY [Bacteroidota bacterium]